MQVPFRVALCLFCLGFAALSAAPIVDVLVTPELDGTTTFQYSVTADPVESILGFSISVPDDIAPGLNVTSPAGWTHSIILGSGILWLSSDAVFDIEPGLSAVFALNGLVAPSSLSYLLYLADPETGFPTGTDSGSMLGPFTATSTGTGPPEDVPEPATILLTGLLLAVLWLSKSRVRGAGLLGSSLH